VTRYLTQPRAGWVGAGTHQSQRWLGPIRVEGTLFIKAAWATAKAISQCLNVIGDPST